MKKLNIVFFSANRAEYGLIHPFIDIFSKNNKFKTELVISGSHFDKNFGFSFNEIKNDNLKKYTRIKISIKTNKLIDTSIYFNSLQSKINLFLKKKKIDLIFLSSDRFETFAFAISAYLRKIPILHYEGGDLTEGGALDDNIRHAITKISNIHLTSNEDSFKRIIKMGEERWRCVNIGYSPLTMIKKKNFDIKEIKDKYSLNIKKPIILFTLHPIIKKRNSQKKDIDEIFKALEYLSKSHQVVITYPNFDPGYKYIIKKIINIKKFNKEIKVIKHLGRRNYHSLLFYIGKQKKGFCMGNSSSGIKEAVIFNCPAINIGDRQKSRLKPTNVIDVSANKKKIIRLANVKFLKYRSFKNPYRLRRIFRSLPQNIIKKLSRYDLMNKKCTI